VLRRRRPERKRKTALALTGISAAVVSALGLRRRRAKMGPAPDAKTIVRKLFEGTWAGDPDVVDRYVAPTYIGHDPSQQSPIEGIDGFKSFIQTFRDSFSNTQVTIEEQVAEEETVATRWTGQGTHTGEISGIAPTGKDVTITGISISRVENGKVVEDHTAWDTLGMLVQLGPILAPGAAEQHHEQHYEQFHEHQHEHDYQHEQEHQHEHY
jgi:predicted ester cyclase